MKVHVSLYCWLLLNYTGLLIKWVWLFTLNLSPMKILRTEKSIISSLAWGPRAGLTVHRGPSALLSMWSFDFAERCLETDVVRQFPAGYTSVQSSQTLFISEEIWNKLSLIIWLLKSLLQMSDYGKLAHSGSAHF